MDILQNNENSTIRRSGKNTGSKRSVEKVTDPKYKPSAPAVSYSRENLLEALKTLAGHGELGSVRKSQRITLAERPEYEAGKHSLMPEYGKRRSNPSQKSHVKREKYDSQLSEGRSHQLSGGYSTEFRSYNSRFSDGSITGSEVIYLDADGYMYDAYGNVVQLSREGKGKGPIKTTMKSSRFSSNTVSHGVTLMLKNIPNKYTRRMLVDALKKFEGKFNFLYMPIDFNTECNVGYAFINLREENDANEFIDYFDGIHTKKVLPGYNSGKVCKVTRAAVQGLEHNVERLKKSPLLPMLRQKDTWQPLLFSETGEEQKFPCDLGLNVNAPEFVPKHHPPGKTEEVQHDVQERLDSSSLAGMVNVENSQEGKRVSHEAIITLTRREIEELFRIPKEDTSSDFHLLRKNMGQEGFIPINALTQIKHLHYPGLDVMTEALSSSDFFEVEGEKFRLKNERQRKSFLLTYQ